MADAMEQQKPRRLSQILAVIMCGLGWLVPAIPWSLIGWIWLYNLVWLFALAAVRMTTEKLLSGESPRWARTIQLINEPLLPHAPSPGGGDRTTN